MILIIQGTTISRIYNGKNIFLIYFIIFLNSSRLGGTSALGRLFVDNLTLIWQYSTDILLHSLFEI